MKAQTAGSGKPQVSALTHEGGPHRISAHDGRTLRGSAQNGVCMIGIQLGILSLWLLTQSLVLNEVYPNPPGPESGSGSPGDRFEWIELYNPTASPLSISGIWLSDGDEVDSLVPVEDSLYLQVFPGVRIATDTLPPQGFALILDREFLGTGDSAYPIQIPPQTVLLTTSDTDLGNGLSNSDPLILLSPTGDTLDVYGTPENPEDSLPLNPEDGVSVERVSWQTGDIWTNWRFSRWGASPGRTNSWSLENDLGWVPESLTIFPALPSSVDSLILRCFLMNYGRSTVPSFEVDLSWGPFSDHRVLSVSLEPDEGVALEFRGPPLPEGLQTIVVSLATQDEDSTDDRVSRSLHVGLAPVVINEIMYNSDLEWIELFNRSSESVDLAGFVLVDSAGGRSGPFPDSTLAPNTYLVIAGSEAFGDRLPGVPFLVPPDGLPTLNNTFETLFLEDANGTLWDRVFYRSSYGGGPEVSLERVSPELPSSLASNWASCQDPTGSTPGRQNSVYLNLDTTPRTFTLSPKAVHPGEPILLTYDLGVPTVDIEVMVFDLRGRLIAHPLNQQGLPGAGQVLWNAPDLPGLYIVYLDARSGPHRFRKKKTFVVMP